MGLKMMCGSPADAIKHLTKAGLIWADQIQGAYFEQGPNAILLSDLFAQKGQLANLTEFPLLHMLYKQGLLIPGHPNRDLPKPLLIGDPEQLHCQKEYFFRGNCGITTLEEYEEFSVPLDQAQEWIEIKQRFARGHFPKADELFECIEVGRKEVELKAGVHLVRVAVNRFEVSFGGETIEVDLNLGKGEIYSASYELPKNSLPQARFAVVHLGEGDGWDPSRPCHSSLILHQDKKYLIDAGPNIQRVLAALGLRPEDLEGIILTHVHDDHFAGIYNLASEKRGLKIYAAPPVFANLIHKFAALLGISLNEAKGWFTHIWLVPLAWNDCDGLEVYPHPSPHPVDTTLFLLRVMGPEGYKTYGHLADITSLNWLRKMLTPDESGCKISPLLWDSLQELYARPLDVKKVDVGGPPMAMPKTLSTTPQKG